MRFLLTPEEAQPVAMAVATYLKKKTMSVSVEAASPWHDAPYRTTVVGRKDGMIVLVEAQGQFSYGGSLSVFASYLRGRRHYAEFYIATLAETDAPGSTLKQMKEDGVGWLLVEDQAVTEHEKARNWALVVTPDPTLAWGKCRPEVSAAIKKFNEVDRKDGLRDLCEIFEREVEELTVLGSKKGLLKAPEKILREMDLAHKINTLASRNAYTAGYEPIASDTLKTDLHSFRDARNLVNHKVRGRREDKKRAMSFTDKMLQGSRLVAEIVSLQNRLRKMKIV